MISSIPPMTLGPSGILGIGIDLMDARRIERLILRYGKVFLEKIFLPEEMIYAEGQKKPFYAYAKRFAAKEAFSKAIGTGMGADLSWLDLAIAKDIRGKPQFIFSRGVYERLCRLLASDFYAHLSLSDEVPYVQAFVVLEKIKLKNIKEPPKSPQG